MAYTINLTDGTIFAVVENGTVNTQSSVTLVGKNYAGYGEFLDENFIHMLENFSNGTAPTAPLLGQLWYDKTNSRLAVFRGEYWKTISGATAVAYPGPSGNIVGDLWWDTTNDQLKTWSGTAGGNVWKVAGPVYTRTQNVTGAFPIDITDVANVPHVVTGLYASGALVGIVNTDAAFVPSAGYVSSFPQIFTGTTVRANAYVSGNIVNNGNLYISAAGSSNVVVVTSNSVNVTGSVSTTGNIVGGNLVTPGYVSATGNVAGGNIVTVGIVSSGGNVYGSNLNTAGVVSAAGNVIGGNITTVGSVTGGNVYTSGNVSASSVVIGTYLQGIVLTNAQPYITSLGTLGNLSVAGNVTAGRVRTANLEVDLITSFSGNTANTSFSIGSGANIAGFAAGGAFNANSPSVFGLVVANGDGPALGVGQVSNVSGSFAGSFYNSTSTSYLPPHNTEVGLASYDVAGYFYNVAANNWVELGTPSYAIYSQGTVGPFTGSHDALIPKTEQQPQPGDIVIDVSVYAAPSMYDVICVDTLSTQPNQPGALGVVSCIAPPGTVPSALAEVVETAPGSFELIINPIYTDINDYNIYIVNALGEGLMNVCGEGGNIAIGDLIVTSSMPGKGMKQADEFVRNYTVAKARQAVTFSSPTQVKQIAVVYVSG